MAPLGCCSDFLVWRFSMATPSTTARFLAARISRTLPALPLWEPAMTTTWSPRLTWNLVAMLENLRRKGDDLHEVLRTQFASAGAEDAGALGIVGRIDDDDGVAVETQVAAIRAADGSL